MFLMGDGLACQIQHDDCKKAIAGEMSCLCDCRGQTALERQHLSRAYLAHHELGSDIIIVIVTVIVTVIVMRVLM